jgi:hypothetical protein
MCRLGPQCMGALATTNTCSGLKRSVYPADYVLIPRAAGCKQPIRRW